MITNDKFLINLIILISKKIPNPNLLISHLLGQLEQLEIRSI